MSSAVIHLHPAGPLVALVGNPNCGKTALFNLLTGSRQKVANYAGVTVERKEGRLISGGGQRSVRVLDLPGTYSLYPRSPDERITADVLAGRATGERRPDLVVCVVDATNLRRTLRLLLPVLRQGLPTVVALNMADLAERRGVAIDVAAMMSELGVPVIPTVGVRANGDAALRALIGDRSRWPAAPQQQPDASQDDERVRRLVERIGLASLAPDMLTDRIDRVVLHPVVGPLLLALLLFLMFQAVFSWARLPMEAIQAGTALLSKSVAGLFPEGTAWSWVGSLLGDGLIAGVGGVLVFLPQILVLFAFILVLEESGYLPRAAFLLDRVMGSVGLSGRSFIPLLSSFACAIPGIMATRTIADPRDRLVTMFIAPLMTCSARLPVYTLLIAAFVPPRTLVAGIGLQGLVLFALYCAGIGGALAVAWVLKHLTTRGEVRLLMMELPPFRPPTLRHVALGLLQRTRIFLRRVGGVIVVLTLALWVMASYPTAPAGATGAPIEYSAAGMLGHLLAHLFAPLGFNWQISVALVPGLAAREVVVSSLGTVYALGNGEGAAGTLAGVISHGWRAATAYSLLAWFVFAPQCLSTLAAVRRETGNWLRPAMLAAYLFALAYAAAFVTYRVALLLGAG